MAKKQSGSFTFKVIVAVILLIVLFSIASCTAVLLRLESDSFDDGNVAIVPIEGVIMSQGGGFGSDVADADTIVGWLEDARDNDDVVGVILEINSPGGSAVGSDEIGTAVKSVMEANKTVVVWMREVAASGGYWVASPADHIVANRMTITGSIGVIGSYFGFDEFLDDWNITYRRFVSGERKDIGSPFRPMNRDEQAFIQEKLDTIHDIFIDEVAANRGLDRDYVESLATGEYYLGIEALQNGLVDELGGYDEAVNYVEWAENVTADPFWYSRESSLLEVLYGLKQPVTFGLNQKMQYALE